MMLTAFYLIAAFGMFVSCCMMFKEANRDFAPDLIDWAHIILVSLLWPFMLVTFGLLALMSFLIDVNRSTLPRT
jgi:hypothetical protein